MLVTILLSLCVTCLGEEIFGCGGFIKSNYTIKYSRVEVKLYTKQGSLKYQTDCAPNNGYYLIPLYDKGHFILKIEPPVGWKFHPSSVPLQIDGKTDLCSQNKDINFVFMGFTVFGKVISNSKSGPSGVLLSLRNSAEEVIQTTISADGGTYSFQCVLPGIYIIEGSHEKWLFDQHIEKIEVKDDNVKMRNSIIVAGFDVRGHVLSDGEPIQGVNFLIFSNREPEKTFLECNADKVKSFGQKTDGYYVCHVTSKNDGTFMFPCLPPGNYTLIPFYKGEHIEFDVSPSKVQFEVKHDSILLKENFQVQGFSVNGYILTTPNENGVSGAKVFVDDKLLTITDSNGRYHLENMRTGKYKISVTAPNMQFDPVVRKITPNTPQLSDIFATKFSVCGHIQIDEYFSHLKGTDRLLILSSDNDFFEKVRVGADGKFCIFLYPGKYVIEPDLSDEEKHNGMKFLPLQYAVDLRNQPVLDVLFTQFLAAVGGQIRCIGNCGSLQVMISPLMFTDNSSKIKTLTSDDGKFHFAKCLPGKYILSIDKKSWCFLARHIEFEITDKDIMDLSLVQSGFQIILSLSHSSYFKVKYPSGVVHSLQLENDENFLCLPERGMYEFVPFGCHLYVSNSFIFDTNNPQKIEITAVKHLVSGSVFTEMNISDVKVQIMKSGGFSVEKLALEKPVEKVNNFFKYIFSVFVEPYSEWEITVTSTKMLFRPLVTYVKVLNDCINNVTEIFGRRGLFITGSVKPALENVKIKVTEEKSAISVSEVYTHPNGTYSVGPLDSENTYTVTAEKEGYFFTAQESLTDFFSHRLAEITVEVITEEGLPLSRVLISLSGGKEYKKNSLTRKSGKVVFSNLHPGQYFVRSMLKEFQFYPSAKMIEVKEGIQMHVKIKGKRVAYSVFGIVTSLTGESEIGVVIEATGLGECHEQQEDTITEQAGLFRLRGLLPKCQYSLNVKKESEVNQHIIRSTPSEIPVQVLNDDIVDIHIIVFRNFVQVDISGSVKTAEEYITTLKVKMFSIDYPDQILHTINLGKSGFFFLPSILIDERCYTLQLSSSLPSSLYMYEEPSIMFCANISFTHFTFTFEPYSKSIEQEFSQGSILALPLSVIFGIIIYNHSIVLKIVIQIFHSVAIFVCSYNFVSSTDVVAFETASARRKFKTKKIT